MEFSYFIQLTGDGDGSAKRNVRIPWKYSFLFFSVSVEILICFVFIEVIFIGIFHTINCSLIQNDSFNLEV